MLGVIIDRCIKVHGIARTAELLDVIKSQGFKYSTKGAITISVADIPGGEGDSDCRSGKEG